MAFRYCIELTLPEQSPGWLSIDASQVAAPAWALIYVTSHCFDAADDAEAMDIAERLQRQHDGAFLMLCGGLAPSGWCRRPCYADHLFRMSGSHGLVPVVC